MNIKPGSGKSLAYAYGAAIALHAVGIGYLLFACKPSLSEGPRTVTSAPNPPPIVACGQNYDMAVRSKALEALRYPEFKDDGERTTMDNVSFKVSQGQISRLDMTEINVRPLAPEQIILSGLRFPIDCHGSFTIKIAPTGKERIDGYAPPCPRDVAFAVERKIRDHTNLNSTGLPITGITGISYAVKYNTRRGIAVATQFDKVEYRTTVPGSALWASLSRMELPKDLRCSYSVAMNVQF